MKYSRLGFLCVAVASSIFAWRRWLESRRAIADHLRTQAELRAAQAELEARVAERTAELQNANALLEREQAQLREREQHYRALIDYGWGITALVSPEGLITYISPAITRVFGYSVDEYVGYNAFEFVAPEDAPAVRRTFAAVLQAPGASVSREFRHRHRDGSWRWVQVSATNLLAEPNVQAIVAHARDITEQKQVEEAFRLQTDLYDTLLKTQSELGEGFIVIAAERILYANEAFCQISGYRPTELGSLPSFAELIAPEQRARLLERYRQRPDGEPVPNVYETALLHKAGRRVEVEVAAKSIETAGQPRLIAIVRDITARKRADKRVQVFASLGARLSGVTLPKEAARIIVEAADELIGWDAASVDLYDARANLLDDLLALDIVNGTRQVVPSGSALQAPSALALEVLRGTPKLILREQAAFDLGALVPFGDKSRPSASLIFVPIRTGSTPVGLLSIHSYTFNAYTEQDLQDLQALADHCGAGLERSRLDRTLAESEARYRELFENANDIIYTHDLAGNFTSVNQKGELATGYTREQVLKMNIAHIVVPEYLPLAREMIAKKVAGGGPTSYELQIFAKDGRRVLLEVSTRLIYQGDRAVGVQGIARDITERKRAEEALEQSAGRRSRRG